MIKKLSPLSKIAIISVIVTLILSSCTPQKKLIYLQDKGNHSHEIDSLSKNNYKLRSKDVLYISINSLDKETFKLFNQASTSGLSTQNNISLYINSHTISDSGYVDLPILGKIKLIGLDLEEAKKTLEDSVKTYIKFPNVNIKLVSFKITLLGDIKTPGVKQIYDTKLNIFEAIGLGGDLTIFGNRQILLIREEGSEKKIFEIDLTDRNIINEEYYNLLPNDIIYITPTRAKMWGFSKIPIATTLSLITTTLVIISFIQK